MTLRKRIFGKADITHTGWRFYVSLAIGILFTIIFFYYGQVIREIFRYFSYTADYDSLILLTPVEAYFYDFFFAFIASVGGFAAFSRTVLSFNTRIGFGLYSRIMLDQTGFPGYYIFLFAKLGLMYGGLAWNLALFKHVNLMQEMWMFFGASIIVLLLHQWATARLRIRQVTAKVMYTACAGQLMFCATLALFPIVNYNKLNTAVLNQMPSHILNYRLPSSRVYERNPRVSLTEQVSVGYIQGIDHPSILFYFLSPDTIGLHDLADYIPRTRDRFMDSERADLEIQLYADANVPATFIINLVKAMRIDGSIKMRFIVKHESPNMGIPTSFKGLDFLYDATFSRHKLGLRGDQILLNDSVISKAYLYKWAKEQSFVEETEKKPALLVMSADKTTNYRSLLKIYEELYAARVSFTNEQVLRKFNRTFDEYESRYSDKEAWDYAKTFVYPTLIFSETNN